MTAHIAISGLTPKERRIIHNALRGALVIDELYEKHVRRAAGTIDETDTAFDVHQLLAKIDEEES
jgi:hypothetical protein